MAGKWKNTLKTNGWLLGPSSLLSQLINQISPAQTVDEAELIPAAPRATPPPLPAHTGRDEVMLVSDDELMEDEIITLAADEYTQIAPPLPKREKVVVLDDSDFIADKKPATPPPAPSSRKAAAAFGKTGAVAENEVLFTVGKLAAQTAATAAARREENPEDVIDLKAIQARLIQDSVTQDAALEAWFTDGKWKPGPSLIKRAPKPVKAPLSAPAATRADLAGFLHSGWDIAGNAIAAAFKTVGPAAIAAFSLMLAFSGKPQAAQPSDAAPKGDAVTAPLPPAVIGMDVDACRILGTGRDLNVSFNARTLEFAGGSGTEALLGWHPPARGTFAAGSPVVIEKTYEMCPETITVTEAEMQALRLQALRAELGAMAKAQEKALASGPAVRLADKDLPAFPRQEQGAAQGVKKRHLGLRAMAHLFAPGVAALGFPGSGAAAGVPGPRAQAPKTAAELLPASAPNRPATAAELEAAVRGAANPEAAQKKILGAEAVITNRVLTPADLGHRR